MKVTPESLDKGLSYDSLLRIALEGSEEERDTLLNWSYGGLPGFVYETLCRAAGRGYLVEE